LCEKPLSVLAKRKTSRYVVIRVSRVAGEANLFRRMMRMIEFACGNCGHTIKVPENYAGKRVRCLKCTGINQVPATAPSPAPVADVIKFRCPSCNQKIGVKSEYVGRKVRCAKCKNPITIPQAGGVTKPQAKPRPAPPPSNLDILRAGGGKRASEEDSSFDLIGMNDLALAEQSAPSVEMESKPQPAEQQYQNLNLALSGYSRGLAGQASYCGDQQTRKSGKTICIILTIVGAVFTVLLISTVYVWYSAFAPKTADDPRLGSVQALAENCIRLLGEKKIDEAGKLLSPELKATTKRTDIEALANRIGNKPIVEISFVEAEVFENPSGDHFVVSYGLLYDDDYLNVALTAQDKGGEFAVGTIFASGFSGRTGLSVPESAALIEEFEKVEPVTSSMIGLPCATLILVILYGLFCTGCMWSIYEKAGEPGWAVIVPIYNAWVYAKVGDKPGWLGLAMYACGSVQMAGALAQGGAALAQFVLYAIISVGVAKAFDRSVPFGMGIAFLPFIFIPILAFTATE
jgi:hypothetical protein